MTTHWPAQMGEGSDLTQGGGRKPDGGSRQKIGEFKPSGSHEYVPPKEASNLVKNIKRTLIQRSIKLFSDSAAHSFSQ